MHNKELESRVNQPKKKVTAKRSMAHGRETARSCAQQCKQQQQRKARVGDNSACITCKVCNIPGNSARNQLEQRLQMCVTW